MLAVSALNTQAAEMQGPPRLSVPSLTLGAAPSAPLPGAAALPSFATALPAMPALPVAAALPQAAQAAPRVSAVQAAQAAPSAHAAAPLAHAQFGAGPAAQGSAQPLSLEASGAEGARRFDHAGSRDGAPDAGGFVPGRFESATGGGLVAYKRREGSPDAPARVYSGGLALNESFDPLFATQRAEGHEVFLWTRGHPPTAWTPTQSVIDADARDLARAIVLAAKDTRGGQVELALHSFGTLVFQRLVQLRGEPEVDAALAALRGSRVFLLNATTHYEGSEHKAGPEFAQMGAATKAFVGWLDMMDGVAQEWEAAARLNPFLSPSIGMWLAQWRSQRAQLMGAASQQAAAMMKKDLEQPWPAELDGIRRRFVAALEHDSRDAGWQESLLRRSSDMFRLEMTKKDVAAIRAAGIKLELVHAVSDQLLNWTSAKILFDLLGIKSPDAAPPAGTVLHDRSGQFTARLVEGDHYFPLKRSDELSRLMRP